MAPHWDTRRWVNVLSTVYAARDIKGVHAKDGRAEFRGLTGVDDLLERPEEAELHLRDGWESAPDRLCVLGLRNIIPIDVAPVGTPAR